MNISKKYDADFAYDLINLGFELGIKGIFSNTIEPHAFFSKKLLTSSSASSIKFEFGSMFLDSIIFDNKPEVIDMDDFFDNGDMEYANIYLTFNGSDVDIKTSHFQSEDEAYIALYNLFRSYFYSKVSSRINRLSFTAKELLRTIHSFVESIIEIFSLRRVINPTSDFFLSAFDKAWSKIEKYILSFEAKGNILRMDQLGSILSKVIRILGPSMLINLGTLHKNISKGSCFSFKTVRLDHKNRLITSV